MEYDVITWLPSWFLFNFVATNYDRHNNNLYLIYYGLNMGEVCIITWMPDGPPFKIMSLAYDSHNNYI